VNVPIVYHPDYYADIGPHVFPTRKFSLVLEAIRRRVGDITGCFHRPSPATREQLLRVHAPEYLPDLDACRWTPRTSLSELPLTKEIVDAYYPRRPLAATKPAFGGLTGSYSTCGVLA